VSAAHHFVLRCARDDGSKRARARALPALALALALAACGTSGMENASLANTPVPAGKARLTVTRVSTLLYAAAPASLTLNGAPAAELAAGGGSILDVPAGPVTLAVSAWSYPGTFSVRLAPKAGQTIALVIEPREASLASGTLLGPLGGLFDASVNENAGAFQIRVVEGAGDEEGLQNRRRDNKVKIRNRVMEIQDN
jgi:hypothetical protein